MVWLLNTVMINDILPHYMFFLSSASNRIIHAKDHASIQINIADVDEKTGIALPTYKTYAICGSIRRMVCARKSKLTKMKLILMWCRVNLMIASTG